MKSFEPEKQTVFESIRRCLRAYWINDDEASRFVRCRNFLLITGSVAILYFVGAIPVLWEAANWAWQFPPAVAASFIFLIFLIEAVLFLDFRYRGKPTTASAIVAVTVLAVYSWIEVLANETLWSVPVKGPANFLAVTAINAVVIGFVICHARHGSYLSKGRIGKAFSVFACWQAAILTFAFVVFGVMYTKDLEVAAAAERQAIRDKALEADIESFKETLRKADEVQDLYRQRASQE